MKLGFEIGGGICYDADIGHRSGAGSRIYVKAGDTIPVELPNGRSVPLTGTKDGFVLDATTYRAGDPPAYLIGGMRAKVVASPVADAPE